MIIACPACGKKFRVADEKVSAAGKRFKCLGCGFPIARAPSAESSVEPDLGPQEEKLSVGSLVSELHRQHLLTPDLDMELVTGQQCPFEEAASGHGPPLQGDSRPLYDQLFDEPPQQEGEALQAPGTVDVAQVEEVSRPAETPEAMPPSKTSRISFMRTVRAAGFWAAFALVVAAGLVAFRGKIVPALASVASAIKTALVSERFVTVHGLRISDLKTVSYTNSAGGEMLVITGSIATDAGTELPRALRVVLLDGRGAPVSEDSFPVGCFLTPEEVYSLEDRASKASAYGRCAAEQKETAGQARFVAVIHEPPETAQSLRIEPLTPGK